ncbi:MAG: YopT-type cysteine protease domain-containing protein [Endozoicomonas sp. (ex Botrylloides leachii)]|nr:YopT-type cysteine protease domain-containing protein [Endozoicomonas sp. (ex Botrylloides leachii)]
MGMKFLSRFSQQKLVAQRKKAGFRDKEIGVCFSLAVNWLSIMYRDRGTTAQSESRMLQLYAKHGGSIGGATYLLQSLFMRRHAQDINDAQRIVLNARGLKMYKTAFEHRRYNIKDLWVVLNQPERHGILYNIYYKQNEKLTGHSIAFFKKNERDKKFSTFKSNTSFIAFDPNYGEWEIDATRDDTWKFVNYLSSQLYRSLIRNDLVYVEPQSNRFS